MPAIIFLAFGRAILGYLGQFQFFRSGDSAPWGVYVGANRPLVAYVGSDGEHLPGLPGHRYLRIPALVVVLGSPFLGLAYILLFPVLLAFAAIVALARRPQSSGSPILPVSKDGRHS
ncbi:MAG: hypothetical protein HC923_04985 [Myxococcales bacterium]|nr:hypothetical protein [Myxococcales bacterium]